MTQSNSEPHRSTITFKPPAASALTRSMARERRSQQEIVNRAVEVYDFIAEHRALGIELLMRLPDSTTETIHII